MGEISRVVSILFLEFILIITTLQNSFCHGNSNVLCFESERNALLMFKKDLEDPSNRLSSWSSDQEDCCKWAGVVCNNVTGHVQELHLMTPFDGDIFSVANFEAFQRSKLGGKINPSLLDLKYLTYLNLTNTNFEGIQIPKFLGSMTNLRYLDLYNAQFMGMIPHELGNLSSLRYLRISGDYRSDGDLQWLSGLSYLEHLGLYMVNLSKASDWLQSINMLPSLSELHLSYCQLDHIPSLPHINFTSLTILDMSHNNFHTSLPNWVFNLGSLTHLDLRLNQIQGEIPSGLQNITGLTYLDLSYNHFNSSIPTWLFTFSHLKILVLSGNSMQGLIPSTIGNLSSLTRLDFRGNELQGTIPKSLGNLCNLKKLELSYNNLDGEVSQVLETLSGCISHSLESLSLAFNNLSGELPDQLGLFQKLVHLSLFSNSISGPIPESLGQLTNLEEFVASDNLLEGVVSEAHFTNLINLVSFYASGNRLVLKVDPDWIPPFQLTGLVLGSWHLGPQFPKWLNSQKYLDFLDLSCTGISDSIPSWIGSTLTNLKILNLRSNKFNGEIPSELCRLSSLQTLDLAYNNLSGTIPRCVNKLEAMVTNMRRNDFYDFFIVGGVIENAFVMAKGREVEYDSILTLVASFDLSSNNLSGEVPDELTFLLGLVVLNLSNNHLTGKMPVGIGDMLLLESLDLSRNQLSGDIPPSVSRLTFIGLLNLSHNNLTGRIPSSTQLQSLNDSNFVGNHLCGPPLTVNCSAEREAQAAPTDENEGDQVEWFYLSMGLGFVVGFWGVFGPILFKRSWRYAYFVFLDLMWYKLCEFCRKRRVI